MKGLVGSTDPIKEIPMSSTLLANLRTQWDNHAAQMNAITERAAAENRDLNDVERANFDALNTTLTNLKPRIEQLVEVDRSLDTTAELFASVSQTGRAELLRTEAPSAAGRYRTAGEYLFDVFRSFGTSADLTARQRVQQAALINRTEVNGATVADQTLDDIVGIVPEPIIGPIWKAVDASRPVHNTLVSRGLTAPLLFRPKLTQRTQVGPQGVAGRLGSSRNTGATVDEKKPFVSRDMKLTRVDVEPVALGGVVDVSLWAEMLSPGLLDIIVSDLADEYAIQSEIMACAEVARAGTASAIGGIDFTPATLNEAIYEAAAKVYDLTKRMPSHIGMSVDVWAMIGGLTDDTGRPIFPAIFPSNAPGQQAANSFVGQANGVPRVVSPGFDPGTLVVYAADSIESFERRLGVLQAVEPERAGRVVSYSGLYTALAMDDGAAVSIPINPAPI
jgi:hypothetical protein